MPTGDFTSDCIMCGFGCQCRTCINRTPLSERERRLLIALHDAIRRPMGVVPDSAVEFYSQEMADEAERRRPKANAVTDEPRRYRAE